MWLMCLAKLWNKRIQDNGGWKENFDKEDQKLAYFYKSCFIRIEVDLTQETKIELKI